MEMEDLGTTSTAVNDAEIRQCSRIATRRKHQTLRLVGKEAGGVLHES